MFSNNRLMVSTKQALSFARHEYLYQLEAFALFCYQLYLAVSQIDHMKKHNTSSKWYLYTLTQNYFNESYQITLREKPYSTMDELHKDLDV